MRTSLTRRRFWSALPLLPLAIVGVSLGCSSSPATVFESGTTDELQIAKDLAFEYLDQDLGLVREGRASRRDFSPMRVEVDELAMAHVRVQQMHRDVPIFGAEMIVHMNRDGSLFAMTDRHVRTVSEHLDVEPALDAKTALDIALSRYSCSNCLSAPPNVDLWILDRPQTRSKEPRLAYRVELEKLDGPDEPEMPVIFLDAKTGEELWRYDNLQSGSGPSYYSGTVQLATYFHASSNTYFLEDTTRKMGTFDYRSGSNGPYRYSDANDIWDGASQKAAVDAHFGGATTYDYFKNVHGRNGIDGNGGPAAYRSANGVTNLISSAVHYKFKLNNAYWASSKMLYGDGDGVNFGPLVTLDICGHEMTHGITERSAKLVYAGESGALNESMSDVFGVMVERYARGENANTWKIGEDATTPGVAGDALRYMDDPHLATNDGYTADDQPDHYSERYTGSGDNGGVHYNSGIANKAFYLVAKGGAHHLGGSMGDVGLANGIGPDKAAAIWYKALTSYMTSTTDFAGARTATINAAKAIHGAGSAEEIAVTQAWFLVGVGTAPTQPCTNQLCTASSSPLVNGCDPCTTKVCAVDSYCCSTAWDAICVKEAVDICGKSCTTCSSGSFTGPGQGEIAAHPSLNFGSSSAFTVAYWANLTSASAHVMVKGDNGTNEWSIVTNPGDQLCFRRQGIPPNIACHTTTYNQWHHYVVTHAANGDAVMYEDGVAKAMGNGSIGTAAATALKIGNYGVGDAGAVGRIDHVAIWNKVLPASDIAELALRTKPPAYISSLVGEWKFDEGKGTTVEDTTGYGKVMNLTQVGWSATCAACPPDVNDVNGNGTVCQPYASCSALLAAKPGTPSGMHLIDPDGAGGNAPFGAYCDMTQNGGGWTLAFNYGTSFNKTTLGTSGANCFDNSDCVNLAFSRVPIGADMMFDGSNTTIVGANQGARSVILGVDAQIVGKTVHYLMNNGGDWPIDNVANTNVTNTFAAGYDCDTWPFDYGYTICTNTDRLVLNDVTVGCGAAPHAIGSSKPGNCAGWPADAGFYWPTNYRVWVR